MEFKYRILVVDDDLPTQDLIVSILSENGWLIETAADGSQALLILVENSFDLIITDLMMPAVSGLDVLAEAKRRWPATEVVLVTAHGSLGTALEALRHGAYDYVVKPFTAQELLLSTQRALDYHQLKLEKETLLESLQRQVQTRDALVKAAQRIATVLDQAEVIHTILEAVFNVFPEVDMTAVYYKWPEKEAVVRGLNSERAEVNLLPFEESMVLEALHGKRTVYYPEWQPVLSNSSSLQSSAPVSPQSLIIEPLLQTGASLGTLMIISRRPAAFGEDDRQVVTMLATQAAIALQNAHLYAEARRVDELEALYEAGQAINRTLDLQETLTTTLSILRNLTGAAIGHVYLYAPEQHRLGPVITLGEELALTDDDRRQSADIALRLLARDPATGEQHLLITTPSPSPTPKEATGQTVASIKSWLAVLLVRANSLPVGVLELGSEKDNVFTGDDVRLVQVIAAQATTATENARLYEEIRLRLQQTEALGSISQSIVNTLDLSRVLNLIVHAAIKTIPVATHSWLYLLDEDKASFRLDAWAAEPYTPAAPAGLAPYRQQVIQQAARQLSPLRRGWLDETQLPWSLLVTPLKVNDQVIGVLSVESSGADTFGASEEILLNAFASHASIAIQNANLFRELSSAYRDLAHHQAEILRSHKTLQALFDGITDGLYILDRDMRIVAINQAEARRLGLSPEPLIGQPCEAALWSEAAPLMTRVVRETFMTGHEGNWESQSDAAQRGPFVNRDVRTYPIFLSAAAQPPVEATGRIVEQVIILAQDVSEKRQLQASLFRSANLATVGRLAASIAHQINNPLTVVIANSQLLELTMDPDSPDYPVIHDMIESGNQIRQIVQNLLDFSTQDSYDWFETDVQKTIEDGLALVVHPLRKSHVEVKQQIDPLSPIIASASHLKLVWMNLLLNARDAIVERGQKGLITIRATQESTGCIRVQITDNGTGITPEHQAQLFRPFFSTKPPERGLGLGLYTCHTIVEHHQGQIELENNSNGPGVTATVILPLQPAR